MLKSDVPLSAEHAAPVRLLQAINKNSKWDGLWKKIDDYRHAERKNWPAWCFLPVEGWRVLVRQSEPQYLQPVLTPVLLGRINMYAMVLAAVGSWRPTQDIFVFDNEAFEAVAKSDTEAHISVENLLRLPAWSVYIRWRTDAYDGFFATLEYRVSTSEKYLALTFLNDTEGGLPKPFSVRIPLQKSQSVSEALDSLRAVCREDASRAGVSSVMQEVYFDEINKDDVAVAVSLVLYLCSEYPEIDGLTATPSINHPQPQRVKNGWRIFPPAKPKLHAVAEKIGYAIREYQVQDRRELSGRKLPPHIRRGHFARYWYGPRNSPHRCYDFRWIPPLPINLLEDDESGQM